MKTLHIALLVMLGTGIGVRAADVSDLTYVNNTLYVTITDCDEDATGALESLKISAGRGASTHHFEFIEFVTFNDFHPINFSTSLRI